MTLDETIQNFEELAETQRKLYERIKDVWDIDNQEAVLECAEENEQLADWLKELKARRDEEYLQAKFRRW